MAASLMSVAAGGTFPVRRRVASDSTITELADHFHLLLAARVVKSERAGKQVFYSIYDHRISGLLANMIKYMAEPHPEATP